MRNESEIYPADFDILPPEERARIRRERAAEVIDEFATAQVKGGARRKHGHGMGHGGMGAVEKPRDFGATMKKMIAYLGAFKLQLIAVFIFAIGGCVFNIVGPKVMSEATTLLFEGVIAKIDGSGQIAFDAISRVLIITIILYAASTLCMWIQGWFMADISQKTCYRLRRAIIEKIGRMPYGYFEKSLTGDTLSRITNDVDTLGQSLNQGLTQLVTSTVTIIGVTIMMFSINWIMALITLVMAPISALVTMFVVKRSQKYFYAQQELLGKVNSQAEETFSGHVVVKAFGKEDETVSCYKQANDALYACGWKAQFMSSCMMPVMSFIGNVGYVAVAVSGSVLAVQRVITVGDIQAFIQYVKNFTQPITQLAQVSNVLQQMAAAAERIFDFLAQEEEPAQTVEHDIEGKPCSVTFDHVWFGYEKDKPIIKDFTVETSCGDTVAIVGPTGAGKTTIVKLLMRFYDVDAGKICIGGTDINTIERDQERALFAMVLQDTWLFKGTIRDNIRYGRLEASDEEVEEAAREACVHHFITTLPGEYDFVISEDASNISVGQRQLITIARALIAQREMLILDEATSSVDTRTEIRIQIAMDNLMKGKTSFVIAHRLSTIKNADLIIVLDKGGVREMGKHEELLSRGGYYAELYNAQFAHEDTIEHEDER